MKLLYRRLQPDAVAPTRAYTTDVGFDVCSREQAIIAPGELHSFATGLVVWLDSGQTRCYLRAAPKSGLAMKQGIDVLAGVIDPGYRGELIIVTINHGKYTWVVEPGTKICQLIPTLVPFVESCSEVFEVETTDRGVKGFGSSGR